MDNHQESLQAAEQAIRLNPAFAAPHNVRGAALSRMGRWHEAVAEYDEAIRLNPDFPRGAQQSRKSTYRSQIVSMRPWPHMTRRPG